MPNIKSDFFFGSEDATPPRRLNNYFNSLTAEVGDMVRVVEGPYLGRKGRVEFLRPRGILPVVVSFNDGSFISFEYYQLRWAV